MNRLASRYEQGSQLFCIIQSTAELLAMGLLIVIFRNVNSILWYSSCDARSSLVLGRCVDIWQIGSLCRLDHDDAYSLFAGAVVLEERNVALTTVSFVAIA